MNQLFIVVFKQDHVMQWINHELFKPVCITGSHSFDFLSPYNWLLFGTWVTLDWDHFTFRVCNRSGAETTKRHVVVKRTTICRKDQTGSSFNPKYSRGAQGHTFRTYLINSLMRSSFAFEKFVWYVHLLVQLLATGKTTLGYSSILIGIVETNGGNQIKATPLLLVVSAL